MIKLIIAGGREFNDYKMVRSAVLELFPNDKIEVVSGTARGADRLGERLAKARELGLKKFPAQWDTYGKSAGYRRNAEMADYGTHLLAFWDGKSKGTGHMIDLAKQKGLVVTVVEY